MNSVDLSEVLLDEMVILDREPFKDKDDMFNVMTRQFETGRTRFRRNWGIQKGFGFSGVLWLTYMGNMIAIPHGKCKRGPDTRNRVLQMQRAVHL